MKYAILFSLFFFSSVMGDDCTSEAEGSNRDSCETSNSHTPHVDDDVTSLMQLKVNHSKGKRSALNISGEDHGTLAKTTTTGGLCKDWPLWKEGHGFTCDKWAEDPDYRCHWWDKSYEATKTHFQHEWIDKYDYHMTKPSQACCACGGGSTNSPPVAK